LILLIRFALLLVRISLCALFHLLSICRLGSLLFDRLRRACRLGSWDLGSIRGVVLLSASLVDWQA
jgi:hypothetical protein